MIAPLLLLSLALPSGGADTTLRLPRGGAVEIDSRNRDIVVRSGPGDVVTVRGAMVEMDGNTLQVSGDDRRSRGTGAIEVTVPAWARVEVSSVGGNLTFTGATEHLHAETMNGFIHVNGGAGIIELETVGGAVVITDFRGTALSVDAVDGAVAVTNAIGEIAIDNVSEGVVLRGIRSNRVAVSSVNGAIEFEGAFAAGGRYEFDSQNENVTLIVPGDVSARMRISTMNGRLISPQIPATTTGTPDVPPSKDKAKDKAHEHSADDEHIFTAVYGSGAAQVIVYVFNGNVIVRKKP